MAELRPRLWLGACMLLCWAAACSGSAHDASSSSKQASKQSKSETSRSPTDASSSKSSAEKSASEAAGSAAPEKPAADSGKMAAANPAEHEPIGSSKAPAKDECGLHSGYPGDEYCILPPPPDKGFQLHIGPSDYKNVDAKYILGPGDEITNSFSGVSGNDKPIHFYYRQFRMRPGAHHNIITSTAGGGFGMGRRIGTSNQLIEDSPKDGIIAPENKGVGIPLAANQGIDVSLHSINISDKPLLREVWVNFWYRPDDEVTEEVQEMFQTGSVSFAVQPHEETTLGPYRCTISGEGRMLWFYGHRHANNLRFSAWRIRGDQKDLFYEGLNWEEPIVLEYSSTVQNATPNRDMNVEGGWSGVLDMKAGDVIEWECHVRNKTDQVLRFTNETYNGEMCIMDAELVGANCPAGRGPMSM